jgi:PII-like signaling protein
VTHESGVAAEGTPRGLHGERVLMRVQIVGLLRSRGAAGATVFRGIMGFGASARLHTDRLLELSMDLPIVVECVDTAERIGALLPELDRMVTSGLITLERVEVVMYRSGVSKSATER